MVDGHQVFISYPSQHREAADAIFNELTAAGISCWMAPESIPPGTETRNATNLVMRRIWPLTRVAVLLFLIPLLSGYNGGGTTSEETDQAGGCTTTSSTHDSEAATAEEPVQLAARHPWQGDPPGSSASAR